MKVKRKLSLLWIYMCIVVVCGNTSSDEAGKNSHTSVLVLGGGMAGVSAAKTLHENGVHDFIILEGYHDIGGRMRQTEFAGTVVELGANWVQGLKNNPIWEMAQACDLKGNLTMANPVQGLYIVRNETGYDVTSIDGHEEFAECLITLDKIIKERSEAGLSDLDARTGLRLAGWLPKNPAQESIEYFNYDFDGCVPPQFISCRVKMWTNGSIDQEDGKQYFVTDPRGYNLVVKEMAKTFLSPSDTRLQLNKKVDVITWGTNGVSVSTTTGDVYTADYLLVTFGIGVLKSGDVTFKPSLPPTIIEPIFKQMMVDYIKIFLKFPERFWDAKQYIFYANKRRGYYPMWQDLGVSGTFPEDVNILLITVTGEEATRIQYQTDETTKAEIMAVLYQVYGKDIPEATDILYKRWAHDPLFYGTYSNVPVGMTHEDYVVLSSNISRLYFAGEATHELYNGFVHGAYYSGLERAKKIVDHIGKNDQNTKH